MAAYRREIVSVLRKVISEVRSANPRLKPVSNSLAARYLLSQYRCHQVTDERVCKAEEELAFMAKTYLCYLESTRKYEEIFQRYHGRGERTVEEAAKLVGLGLPNSLHDPTAPSKAE